MRTPLYLLVALALMTGSSCKRTSGLTEIRFSNSFNVFEYGSPALPESYAGLPVTGFILGYSLENTEPVTRFEGAFGPTRFAAAGGEAIPCNDGTAYAVAITDSPVTVMMRVVADTGGDDVSDDRNCHCDSKIESMTLYGVAVFFEGMDVPLQIPELTISGDVLCPNVPDGHLVSGDREFGGEVQVDGSIVLRVADGRPGLLADVGLHMIELD